jgi:hypothetical protein
MKKIKNCQEDIRMAKVVGYLFKFASIVFKFLREIVVFTFAMTLLFQIKYELQDLFFLSHPLSCVICKVSK